MTCFYFPTVHDLWEHKNGQHVMPTCCKVLPTTKIKLPSDEHKTVAQPLSMNTSTGTVSPHSDARDLVTVGILEHRETTSVEILQVVELNLENKRLNNGTNECSSSPNCIPIASSGVNKNTYTHTDSTSYYDCGSFTEKSDVNSIKGSNSLKTDNVTSSPITAIPDKELLYDYLNNSSIKSDHIEKNLLQNNGNCTQVILCSSQSKEEELDPSTHSVMLNEVDIEEELDPSTHSVMLNEVDEEEELDLSTHSVMLNEVDKEISINNSSKLNECHINEATNKEPSQTIGNNAPKQSVEPETNLSSVVTYDPSSKENNSSTLLKHSPSSMLPCSFIDDSEGPRVLCPVLGPVLAKLLRRGSLVEVLGELIFLLSVYIFIYHVFFKSHVFFKVKYHLVFKNQI